MSFRSITNNFKDHFKHKYISYYDALFSLYKTRKYYFKKLNQSELEFRKSSDTIFILGSGPSLNFLSSEQKNHINDCDSFGISHSFFLTDIITTYHYFGWHKGRYHRWKELFEPFREMYKDVVIVMHNKSIYNRLVHPRLTPELFPVDPNIFIVKIPESISINQERRISDEEFEKTLLYRGSLSFILHIVVGMGYKKIVLLGVDLNTNDHFYDNMPEMRIEKDARQKTYFSKGFGDKFESQYPKKNKIKTFDRYLDELSDYLYKKKGIYLYIGFEKGKTYGKIPTNF